MSKFFERRLHHGTVQIPSALRKLLGAGPYMPLKIIQTEQGILIQPGTGDPPNTVGELPQDEQAVVKLHQHLWLLDKACEGDPKRVGVILRKKGFLPEGVYENCEPLERMLTNLVKEFDHDDWEYFVSLTPEAAYISRVYMHPRTGLGSGNPKRGEEVGDMSLPPMVEAYRQGV